jgi:hypothetical protein
MSVFVSGMALCLDGSGFEAVLAFMGILRCMVCEMSDGSDQFSMWLIRSRCKKVAFTLQISVSARDRVYAELGKAGIGLTINWDDICSDPRTNQNLRAVDMAGRMLTLAIDQRIRHKQLDYMALNLIGGVNAVKTS